MLQYQLRIAAKLDGQMRALEQKRVKIGVGKLPARSANPYAMKTFGTQHIPFVGLPVAA